MVYLSQHAVRMVEYFAYLGWPMLVVLVLAAVCFWRDLRVRALALTFVVLEVLSLGSRTVVVRGLHIPATLMPWHYLQGLPLLSQSLPNRFLLLADGPAAVVLAFSLDLAWDALPDGPSRRRPSRRQMLRPGRGGPGAPGRRGPGRGAPAAGVPACPGTAPAAAGPSSPAAAPAAAPAWRKAAAVVLIALAIVPIIPLPAADGGGHRDPGRLAAGFRPAPAGQRRAGAGRPAPARHRDALAGGHRRARLGDRRLLHRAHPGHGPGRVVRQRPEADR